MNQQATAALYTALTIAVLIVIIWRLAQTEPDDDLIDNIQIGHHAEVGWWYHFYDVEGLFAGTGYRSKSRALAAAKDERQHLEDLRKGNN